MFVLSLLILTTVVFMCLASYHQLRVFRRGWALAGTVYDVHYQIPKNLVIEGGQCPLLRHSYLHDMRNLFRDIIKILDSQGIKYYASGGTLLAIMRHNALNIPDDDDMDMHCDWNDAPRFFDKDVQAKFRENHIDMLQFSKWDPTTSNIRPINMCLRFRKAKTSTPVVDMFFFCENTHHIAKIHSIRDTFIQHIEREYWTRADISPIQRLMVDGTEVCVPNRPENVLRHQYGQNVMTWKPRFKITQVHQLPHLCMTRLYHQLN